MRDDSDDTTPRNARDADHIWLRQSVTFSVNGQTRTLEMALPLRPGATPDEVDALLDEADAGMRRLSQRLDAHLADVTAAPIPAAAPTGSHAAPTAPSSPARRPTTPQSAPMPVPTPAPASTPAAAPAAAPAAVPAAVPAAKAAPTSGGPDLTRPEFLAALRAMGLDVRSAMERLGVRSLDGLNLREALDLLSRQALREGDAPPAEPPTSSVSSASSASSVSDERAAALAARPAMPAPIGRADAARFEEEDDGLDFELSYPDPDDLPEQDEELAEEDFAPEVAAATPPADVMGDVPDLDELLRGAATPPPTAAPPPAQQPVQQARQQAQPPEPAAPAEEPLVARARAVIAELRAAHAGGQTTGQQRNAYHHVVVGELGETKAAGIVRAVWSLTPEKLGPDQYDALIRWGKLDTFADEVEAVLELLRAEYRAQHGGGAQRVAPAEQPAPTPATTPAPSAEPAARPPARSAARPAEQAPATRPTTRGRASSASARPDGGTQTGSRIGSRTGSQAESQGGA